MFAGNAGNGTLSFPAKSLKDRVPGRASLSRAYQVDNVLNAAANLHQDWCILQCVCSDEVARTRLRDHSEAGPHPAANRDYELYQKIKSRFEMIYLPKTLIDTGEPLERCVTRALEVLR